MGRVSAQDLEAEAVIDMDEAWLRHASSLLHKETCDRLVVVLLVVGKVRAELILELTHGDDPVDDEAPVGLPPDSLHGAIVLVVDGPEDLLDDVLEADDPLDAAVLRLVPFKSVVVPLLD